MTNPTTKRAFTTIVAGPIHLVGTAAQVATYYTHGDGELPPWWAEWDQLLGDTWAMDILESPSDVSRFMRAAEIHPDLPRVGFISNSKLKLESGYVLGAEDRDYDHTAQRLHRFWQSLPAAMQQRYARFGSLSTIEGMLMRREEWVDARWGSATHESDTRIALAKKAKTTTEGSIAADATAADRPIQRAIPLLRMGGLACPRCGWLQRKSDGAVLDAKQLKQRGLATVTCPHCHDHLGQQCRERDNVQDRSLPIFQSDDWQTYTVDAHGRRAIPWGERPRSNPRMALASFIQRRYPQHVDLFIHDEVHECKGARTALGQAFGAMVAASRTTVGMTGTAYGGMASTLYDLLLRLGNTVIRDRWGWNNRSAFVRDVGVVDVMTKEITRAATAGHYDGQTRTSTEVQERAGITADLITIVQNCTYTVLLKDMGFQLPDYREDVVLLDLPTDMQPLYRRIEDEGKAIIGNGGYDALSAYLQATLSWPYQPWRRKTISSQLVNEKVTTPELPAERILPHHTWLAQYCAAQIQQGRRVLLFAEHTGNDDIAVDLAEKVMALAMEQHQTTLKVAILRATTVAPGERNAWFTEQVAKGTNVVICNPRLVKTGLNLIAWPSIVVVEPLYSLYDLFQAKRRAFRPTQTQGCEVTFLGYTKTMSQRALGIVGRKAAAATMLSGDDSEGGLLEFDPGMSLLQELAKQLRSASPLDDANALRDQFRSVGQAIKAEAERPSLVLPATATPATIDEPAEQPIAWDALFTVVDVPTRKATQVAHQFAMVL
ncbi:hypothetical protein [Herpetosiphon llansteffanensis]|uniref:hypothetical protein n=1 Tax=Herpetosiphon llansteffanensis TaxID=2094568 RepID=UPI000D7BC1D9|nr:hypothetical protein [Herpetosiphon llansteffanensis]